MLVSKQRDLLALGQNQLSNQPWVVSLLANHIKGSNTNVNEAPGDSSTDADSGNFYFDSCRFWTREKGGSVQYEDFMCPELTTGSTFGRVHNSHLDAAITDLVS